jgi:hypothetical protein
MQLWNHELVLHCIDQTRPLLLLLLLLLLLE